MDSQQERWNAHFAAMENSETVYDDWLDAYGAELEKSRDLAIVDLGCGSGNNTRYLSERGFKVLACDYSSEAIALIRERFPEAATRHFDMRGGLPFPDASHRVLIADLSIHYFDRATTRKIVNDIERVLTAGGLFLCRVNSTRDVNHGAGEGELLEKNYYNTAKGPKRFFSGEDIEELSGGGWRRLAVKEKKMKRYAEEKILWEAALIKESR